MRRLTTRAAKSAQEELSYGSSVQAADQTQKPSVAGELSDLRFQTKIHQVVRAFGGCVPAELQGFRRLTQRIVDHGEVQRGHVTRPGKFLQAGQFPPCVGTLAGKSIRACERREGCGTVPGKRICALEFRDGLRE